MIPSLVAETRLPELRSHLAPVDGGWAAVAADCVVFLDPHLERVGQVPLPPDELSGARGFAWTVAFDRSLVVLSTAAAVIGLAPDGGVRWRVDRSTRDGSPARCQLDRSGQLWLYEPAIDDDLDELVVLETGQAREVARTTLEDCSDGGALLIPHPNGHLMCVSVGMGQEEPISYWAQMRAGRIVLADCPGYFVTQVTAHGDRYLSIPHDHPATISVHRVPDGTVLGSCTGEDVLNRATPDGFDKQTDSYDVTDAIEVSGDAVIVGISRELDDDRRRHFLLTNPALGDPVPVRYPVDMDDPALGPAPAPGQWLTWEGDVVRLWRADDAA